MVVCLCVVALAPASAAAAGPDAHATQAGAAPASQRLELVLPLAADDGGLAALATAVTTPGSPQYEHYRSLGSLSRTFGASAATRSRVVSYLRRAGATGVKVDATGLFADATMSAGLAQRLFATRLTRFHGARSTRFVAPTTGVHVPGALRGLVTGVVGLSTQPLAGTPTPVRANSRFRAHAASQPASALPRSGTPAGCAAGAAAGEVDGSPATAGFTPNQYLTAYGIQQLHDAGMQGQGVRVALIEIDGYKYSDLQTFAQCFGLGVPAVEGFGVGVRHPLAPGGESTLDLEALDAAAPQLKGIDVYESSARASNTLRALTAPLQNPHRRPQVISASLGLCEPAVAGAIGTRGIRATEGALQMAAITGITVLASSGDQGSADCTASSGLPVPRLAVNYPASSWWVTGVGGTNLLLNASNQITSQIVWNDTNLQPGAAAGGGSSLLFRRPPYQKGVATRSRAVPDVSMLADIVPGYAVYCTAAHDCVSSRNPNPWQAVGGTSAATPLLAGGFAIVDQALEAAHRQDLGFVNPLLYELGRSSLAGAVFSDVLNYSNDIGPYLPNRGRPLGCCQAGSGFDRASGWGSVNLAAFARTALAFEPVQIHLSVPGKQHPLKNHAVLATVTCAGPCRVASSAVIRVGHAGRFEADSPIRSLPAAGSKTFAIRLSHKALDRIRSGLRHHSKVVATVYGITITGRRTVAFRTGGIRMRIKR
ncbi:MAG TPA: S53 family serine peptidase [Solirubrobacteraceae bacterium]|jgi:kumamolisin